MPRPRFERRIWYELLAHGVPLGLRAFFAWLLWQSDILILGTFRSAGEVGWYAAAYQLLRGVRIIPNVLCNPLGPAISQVYGGRGIEGALLLFRRTLKYLVVLAVPIAFYSTVLSKPIINLLYGTQYAASTPAFQILIWATLFIFAEQAGYTLLDNVDRRGFTVWVFGIALTVNVGLNFILIPQYGYMAAAISTVISEGIAFLMLYGFLLRQRWKVGIGRVVMGSVSAGLLSATLLLFAKGRVVLAIPLVILALTIYVLILWVMRIWELEEMEVARKAIETVRRWWRPGINDEEV